MANDNMLSWGGGNHVMNTSGPGDKPLDADARKACATDAGQFGRDAAQFLGKQVTPRVAKDKKK